MHFNYRRISESVVGQGIVPNCDTAAHRKFHPFVTVLQSGYHPKFNRKRSRFGLGFTERPISIAGLPRYTGRSGFPGGKPRLRDLQRMRRCVFRPSAACRLPYRPGDAERKPPFPRCRQDGCGKADLCCGQSFERDRWRRLVRTMRSRMSRQAGHGQESERRRTRTLCRSRGRGKAGRMIDFR